MRRYDIYDIGPPYLWYNITIDILEFGGVEEEVQGGRMVFDVHWNPVASVVISPEALLRRSEDGKVRMWVDRCGLALNGNVILKSLNCLGSTIL